MGGWLGISIGDPTGIGPEVTVKALAQMPEDDWRYLLIGDAELLRGVSEKCGAGLPLQPFTDYSAPGRFFMHNPGDPLPRSLAQGSREAAMAAMAALVDGAERAIRGETAGIVTAPVNKESIIRLGKPFMGQTEFLSEMAGAKRTAMMLLGEDDRGRWLRVALVTTHLPLRKVAGAIIREKVELAIELAAQACRDLKLPRARVGVCGLNPHAGEGGEFGDEEINIIRPAVENAQRRGLDVEGPFPADTLFYYAFKGQYEAVVAMYHDQGLAPLKMIGFEKGINWTLGLPFIRTSPDHGTAYDIAGQNKADGGSMLAAINLARQLADDAAKVRSGRS